MNLRETIAAIMDGTIEMQHVPDARNMVENEIADCEQIIQDIETEYHVRVEYQNKLRTYKKLLNRL
jgi:hypothetical protein